VINNIYLHAALMIIYIDESVVIKLFRNQLHSLLFFYGEMLEEKHKLVLPGEDLWLRL